jgi:hypothetical protein
MMGMRRVFGAVLVLLAGGFAGLVGPAAPACACSCVPVTEAAAYARANTVFAARLVRVSDPVDGQSSENPVTMVFAVDAVYKGKVTTLQEVVTPMSSASCGMAATVGERYLIHARPGEGLGTPLSTTLCDGNRPLSGTPMVAGAKAHPVVGNGGGEAVPPQAVRPDERGWWRGWRGGALGALAGLIALGALSFALPAVVRRRR